MNSSPEPIGLRRVPVAAHVRAEPGAEALDAFHSGHREQSFLRGLEQGRAEVRAELAQQIENLASSLITDAQRNLIELAESSTRIGIAVARELLKLEVVAAGHDIESMVRDALSQLRSGRDVCEVTLHPDDFERLREVRFGSSVTLGDDAAVRRGDVVVTSPQGRLVRSLDESLEAIGEALRAELLP